MGKKYKFTGETMQFEGHRLRRIRYLGELKTYSTSGYKEFLENPLGGWIESEENLSHDGDSCVLDDAKVFGNARVIDNAIVRGEAIVMDNAQITDGAMVLGNAIIRADTIISGNDTWIEGNSNIAFYNVFEHTSQFREKHGVSSHIHSTFEGEVVIEGNSVIEATGLIVDCYFVDVTINGSVNLESLERINAVISD